MTWVEPRPPHPIPDPAPAPLSSALTDPARPRSQSFSNTSNLLTLPLPANLSTVVSPSLAALNRHLHHPQDALPPLRRFSDTSVTSPASYASSSPSSRSPTAPAPLRHAAAAVAHTHAALMPPPPLPRKRKHADRERDRDHDDARSRSPMPESSASPSSHGGDSEYDPVRGARARAPPARPKRILSKPIATAAAAAATTATTTSVSSAGAGGAGAINGAPKVGPNGRPMSREQLRKANHSLIERRRREKINFALSELRAMVPGLGEDGAKGGEFKLEVLERTVDHMRDLKAQVAELQERLEQADLAPADAESEPDAEVEASEDMDVDSEPPPSRASASMDYGTAPASHSRPHSSHSYTYRRQSASHLETHHDMDAHQLASLHRGSHSHSHSHPYSNSHSHTHSLSPRKAPSNTPPSPSMTPPLRNAHPLSPDPNETEPEADLPPPLTLARRATLSLPSDSTGTTDSSSGHTASPRPHPPTIASLIASSVQSRAHEAAAARDPVPLKNRHEHPSPNIYLPFPTPSPTSPFLTYHGGSTASTASSVTGPPEPSPFMAPLPNISLFGSLLDTPNTLDGGERERKHASPPHLAMPPPDARGPGSGAASVHPRAGDLGAEEAANLLLAFSSPETLRPAKTGSTPLMSALAMPPGQRRSALESEEFSLDGGHASAKNGSTAYRSSSAGYKAPKVGKTARDILRM